MSNLNSGYFATDQFQQTDKICELYKELDIDCLLTPGFPVPGIQHGLSQKLCYAAMYTFVYNSMDLPTGVFPVSRVREDEQVYNDAYKPDVMTKNCVQAMTGSKGMPMGIQVSTLPFQDEKCVAIMKHFQELTGFKKNLPVLDIDFEVRPLFL